MKKWYESKTLWINIFGFLIVVMEYAGTINIGDPEALAAGIAVINVILRFITNQPIDRNIM